MKMGSTIDVQVVVLLATGITLVLTMLCFSFLKKKRPVTLNPEDKVALILIEKWVISRDTRRFRFSLPSPDHILGLPVGSFVNVSAILDSKLVVRPYTPITSDDDIGYMDLMIKVYSQGKMSSYMDSLKIGDQILVRGPSGKIQYMGQGVFEVIKSRSSTIRLAVKRIGMIAGGSGITPMLQIIQEIVKRDDDDTDMSLLFSNKTADDILCRNLLSELCCNKLKVHHTLTQSPLPVGELSPATLHEFSSGRVNRAMIEKNLPEPAEDTVILLCGPPGLVKDCCIPLLVDMGYKDTNILVF